MVEAAPLRERRWALLAQAQYLAGRQMEALRTLRRVRVVLARDLGLDPGPDLVALEQAILRQDPALAVEEAAPARADVSPYPGLAAYGEEDAELFFGREEETRICLDRLDVRRACWPSSARPEVASPHSSRAGLAAALRRDGAHACRAHARASPDGHPDRRRCATGPGRARGPGRGGLRPVRGRGRARRFFEALVDHTERGRVVLALRADHIGDLAAVPGLAALVEQGLFLLGPMSPDSLRQAIETPARQHGLVLEPGLTDLLVREIEGEPGALPLLSHALRETWLRHEGRTLTVAGYQASGGVRGAVAQSAESLYVELGDAERAQLRDLVLRLVVPGPRGEPVRGEVPRHQVVADPVQEQLIDQMVTARLVTSDADAIELAHEAVVRAWPRLRGWLEDDLEGQRTRHHLTQAAEDWAGSGLPGQRPLPRHASRGATREWIASAEPRLTEPEQRFLTASEEQAAAEEASAVELARTRGHMVRRLRYRARRRRRPPRASPHRRLRRGRPDRTGPRRSRRVPRPTARSAGARGREHPAQRPPRGGGGRARRHAGDEDHPLPGAGPALLSGCDKHSRGRRSWPPGPEPGRGRLAARSPTMSSPSSTLQPAA